MRIKVTQDHIDKGKRFNAYECPICHAIGLDRDPFVSMNGIFIILHDGKEILLGNTPEAVIQFMYHFDRGYEVQPFEFYLVDNASTAAVFAPSATDQRTAISS